MIVLVDVDGVLANFASFARKLIFDYSGKQLTFLDQDWINTELTDGERKYLYLMLKCPDYAYRLPPVPQAREFCEAVIEMGHQLYVVTSPWIDSATWADDRRRWLKDYMGIEAQNIISTSAKHLVYGDLLIEDTVANANAETPFVGRSCAIITTSYNKNAPLKPWVSRYHNLNEVLCVIRHQRECPYCR